jgi:poly(3-hydroxybutyrate) depolymerase
MKVLMYLFLFAVFTLSRIQAKDSDLMIDKSFKTSSGVTLKYLLFVPKSYSGTQKYPLVVTLHGAGSDNVYQVDNNDQAHPWIEDSVQALWPHFIMVPSLPSGSGSWGGMVGAPATALSIEAKAVLEAIEDLKKQYSLDTNRFIVGGFSIGGAGVYHLIQFMPNYWAAAAPCAAGGDSSKIELIAKTPVWHHHGSGDNAGAALKRMSAALEAHHYPVLRVTVDQVVSSPTGWQNEIKKGTKPQDIIFKNAKPSYDSVSRAVESGASYIFHMFNSGDHESSRLNANHNPLLAKWAFSKVKGGSTTAVSFVPVSSKISETMQVQYGTILTFSRRADLASGPIFTVLGQTCRGHGMQGIIGAQTMWIRTESKGDAVRRK